MGTMKSIIQKARALAAGTVLFLIFVVASHAAAQTWTQHATGAVTKPSARRSHAMAYDSARNVIVLFGGLDDATQLASSETWEWDGNAWTQRAPATSPSPRYGHTMTYDNARNTIVLFGGHNVNGASNSETWEWDGNTWTQRTPATSPSGRSYHAMAYDSTRGISVLFGGIQAATTGPSSSETWEWDGNTWTQRATGAVTKPSARHIHAMAYDAARNVVILFGGLDNATQLASSETWEWDGNTWTQRTPATSPSPRYGHTMAYDNARNVVVLFGGINNATQLANSETWEWDGNTWTQRTPATSPSPRFLSGMAYDSGRDVSVLFGGQVQDFALNGETWEYTGSEVAIGVAIDIKPGSFPNSINLGSGGTVPVAIFSTTTFDARTVDPTTVTLAGAQVALKGKGTLMTSVEDVDGDGLLDLVVHVQTEALQLSDTDTEAVLDGKTSDGTAIRGTDSVRVVP